MAAGLLEGLEAEYWDYFDMKSYYLFEFVPSRELIEMTSGASSESQPSYLNSIEEKPNYEASSTALQLNHTAAASAMVQLCAAMESAEGDQFEDCLRALASLFSRGYTHLFMTQVLLMRKMMNHFTRLGKDLENGGDDSSIQKRMLFVLSIIAEILQQNPNFYYPFTRKFLLTVFSINVADLCASPIRSKILAVLSVIFQNLSRQSKLVKKYGIDQCLKRAVLESYSQIEEIRTLKAMDKTILNMVSNGISITAEEFEEYKVLETVTNFIARSQKELFMVKMKMTMLCMNSQALHPARP